MKIYTEINYEWIDDQLVQTSSKSFEYSGDIAQGGGGGGGGGTAGQILKKVDKTVSDTVSDPLGTVLDAPKAAVNLVADTPSAVLHETGNIVQGLGTMLGIFDKPEQPEPQPVASNEEKESEIWTAGGYKGKKKSNNPFLAIDKGKKFARSTSQFRRPTSNIT